MCYKAKVSIVSVRAFLVFFVFVQGPSEQELFHTPGDPYETRMKQGEGVYFIPLGCSRLPDPPGWGAAVPQSPRPLALPSSWPHFGNELFGGGPPRGSSRCHRKDGLKQGYEIPTRVAPSMQNRPSDR